MRFVGLDPKDATPVLQSIEQLVPEGACQIATHINGDGLTDLLISGKQLSWLSADDCIRGRKKSSVTPMLMQVAHIFRSIKPKPR